MPAKESGYEFWNNVLGSPKYVAAPMVDMSELAYRMLCRRHGAQLCYSPMFHSQQFSQDFLYRQDNFSTCLEDRPLIVQFCANDLSNFLNAALMVSPDCDAVDLNLGCPQAIARKGYYGSFLQDDWDVIRSIVQNASYELHIPVTCKMRILPGQYNKSIEYAKMLEDSGCSVLAVHGRTREQKGHATGLASWDVIKEIKANVNIPVIANGNILSFDDVEDCLQYTGADAVMSAEALLHNPALFCAKTPPVWTMVEEYLQLAEKYNTSIRCVRCHLFKILYLCIYQDEAVQQILTDGSTYDDFYKVIKLLKRLPEKLASVNTQDETKTEEKDSDDIFYSLESSFEEVMDTHNSEQNAANNIPFKPNNFNLEINKDELSFNPIEKINELDCEKEEYHLMNTVSATIDEDVKHLPVWICHSRPRIADNEKGRGCFSKYFDLKSEKSSVEQFMSKKQLRRARHRDRVVSCMRDKRKVKKMRRKQKIAESQLHQTPVCQERYLQASDECEIDATIPTLFHSSCFCYSCFRCKLFLPHSPEYPEPILKTLLAEKSNHPKSCTEVESEKKKSITKKEKKMLIRERLLEAQGTTPKICLNLGLTSLMETKELSRLSSQLRRLYGSNRQSTTPLHLYFCSLSPTDALYQICQKKNDGFSSYVVEMTSDSPEDLFSWEDIIYLTPDSKNVLETLDRKKVYVIGGIVDDIPRKDLCLNHADSFDIQSARLPVAEYLVPYSTNPGTTVLTVNQVFDILLKYYETNDWTESLSKNVPPRKGYCAPSKKEELKPHVPEIPREVPSSSDGLF